MNHDQLRALVWGQAYAAMLAKVLVEDIKDIRWDSDRNDEYATRCADETLEAFDRKWPAPEVASTIRAPPLETQRFGPGIP